MHRLFALLIAVLLLTGCAQIEKLFAKKESAPQSAAGFGKSRTSDLVVTPRQSALAAEWGRTTELPVEIEWRGAQKYSVQITPAADTPPWLKAELLPAIVDPPAVAVLKLKPEIDQALLGPLTLTLETSAYGLSEPVLVTVDITVQRQSGDFEPVLAAPVTVECSNICGKVKGTALTFYDVLKEKDQACSDKDALPEAQRITTTNYTLSGHGFGYGRTCRVAAVYEASGFLSVVNLGLSSKLPRGAVLLNLRGASDCWFSPDNTVALVRLSTAIVPYDVLTGEQLGGACRIPGDFPAAALNGVTLVAGTCTWEIR